MSREILVILVLSNPPHNPIIVDLYAFFNDNNNVEIDCGYRSRSGLHWIKCIEYDGGWIEVRGKQCVHDEPVISVSPKPISELMKPIPKELKNIVGSVARVKEANEYMVDAIIQYLRRLYGDDEEVLRQFLIVENEDGVFVYVKLPTIVIAGDAREVAKVEKAYDRGRDVYAIYVISLDKQIRGSDMEISDFVGLRFSKPVKLLRFGTTRDGGRAVVIEVSEPVRIEEGNKVVVLTPGTYLIINYY